MSIDNTVDSVLEADLAELRVVLARHAFPTSQDDILALLVARHEPSRLLWRAAVLSRTRVYHSMDEVCDEIADLAGTGMPPPPGR
ncbi:MAG TPA: hypothetical protein VES93_14620 [Ornithinibacter sp.]|nr:hypothetical protein [Ornithinibacter sp.]